MDEAERLMFAGLARLPQFRRKVEQAQAIIKEALEVCPAYVACSWGKDSLVVADLVATISPDALVCHVTGPKAELLNNYGEVSAAFCRRHPSVAYRVLGGDGRPSWEVFSAHAHELPSMAILGLRAEEAAYRRISLRKYGLIYRYKSGSWRACPLAWWGWKDVWAYLVAHGLTYLASYDHPAEECRALSRTSSITTRRGEQFGRIERMKRVSPEYYDWWKNV
ncbi:MAG: hypothetical protein HC910_22425 [Spirulinaceae cyanobacterium SM2_1_0]|nr:hypothetical protein [Spirulinaceae cyanobacterium SM2_1_0]